jgi:hypothetical protein
VTDAAGNPVTDSSGNPITGTYTAGGSISFDGMSLDHERHAGRRRYGQRPIRYGIEHARRIHHAQQHDQRAAKRAKLGRR